MVLTNDANAAAIGKRMYGDTKGMEKFVVIFVGTGLGSGIVVGVELIYVHDGFAGDLFFRLTYLGMEGAMMGIFKNKVKLIPSGLELGNSAILVVSALVWKELNK